MISPDAYASLRLDDQWLERAMQEKECEWLIEATADCESVLDYGYGDGLTCKALAEADIRVTMVDGSAQFCNDADRIPGVVAVHSMFEDYSPSGRYDCVIASFILEHIADPVGLLKRIRGWTDKLIVVVGNANSYHRQIAVKMGIQERLDSLSERDKTVGHVKVYDNASIQFDLWHGGWHMEKVRGLGFKPLPNSMLAKLPAEVAKTMMQMEVHPDIAANLFITCKPL